MLEFSLYDRQLNAILYLRKVEKLRSISNGGVTKFYGKIELWSTGGFFKVERKIITVNQNERIITYHYDVNKDLV